MYVLQMQPYYGGTDKTGASSGCTLIPEGGTSVFTVTNIENASKDNRAIDLLGIGSGAPVKWPKGYYTIQIDTIASSIATTAGSGNTLTLSYQVSNKKYTTDAEWALSGTTAFWGPMDVNTGATGYVVQALPPGARFLRVLGTSGVTSTKPHLLMWVN
uniref:Uncharacterized protein n=1 Tax=viral metagenome TaxID=1070528 RepID=A0A6M3J125_9ZZZZ